MQDTDLYQQILGIHSPWQVDAVKLDVAGGQVDIFLTHQQGVKWPCPECGEMLPCRDHVEERVWRHLDTCQFKTMLHARLPRIHCTKHGTLRVNVPWAESGGRFTLLMERLIIRVIEQCFTLTGACRLMGISWDEAFAVMQRAVRRGQKAKQRTTPTHIGVDEKAFSKGHSYMTLVCDLKRSTVEYVSEERTIASLEEYYTGLNPKELSRIEAVCMDMWEPYFTATVRHVPDALGKIVHDRFHVMQHVGQGVDKVRRQENKELLQQQDERLKGSKYLWLYRAENIPEKHQAAFKELRDSDLKVAKAWAMKESLQRVWQYRYVGSARRFLDSWLTWVLRSTLEPMKKVAQMIERHKENILTFVRHRVTNGVAEGLNSKVMSIKRRACGYRNKGHFKTAIYFFCGGLNLYPALAEEGIH